MEPALEPCRSFDPDVPKVQRIPALTVKSELLAVNEGGTAEASVPFWGCGVFLLLENSSEFPIYKPWGQDSRFYRQ